MTIGDIDDAYEEDDVFTQPSITLGDEDPVAGMILDRLRAVTGQQIDGIVIETPQYPAPTPEQLEEAAQRKAAANND